MNCTKRPVGKAANSYWLFICIYIYRVGSHWLKFGVIIYDHRLNDVCRTRMLVTRSTMSAVELA